MKNIKMVLTTDPNYGLVEVKKSLRKYARKALFSQAAKMLCRHGA